MAPKYCFLNAQRPCDLTCKAAFEVDDPVDNIDCYLIWLAYHMGEGFFELKRSLEGDGGGSDTPAPGGAGPSGPAGSPGPKPPKGFPNN